MSARPERDGVEFTLAQLCALQTKARSLELDSLRVRSPQPGSAQRARSRGRGVDYVESRAYLPGDDIRSMDWRVTARSGRPHTKLYQEDNAQHVCLLVDFRASLFFGTRRAFKSVVAAEAAALLCWAAVHQGARVSAHIGRGARHIQVCDRQGRRGALAVLQALVSMGNGRSAPLETQPLSAMLRRARRLPRPGALVVVISDFAPLAAGDQQELARLARRHVVLLIHVYDPLEAAPPPPGRYAITDGREAAMIDTRAAGVQADYRRHFAVHREQLQSLAEQHAMPLQHLCTADDTATALVGGPMGRASRTVGTRIDGGHPVV